MHHSKRPRAGKGKGKKMQENGITTTTEFEVFYSLKNAAKQKKVKEYWGFDVTLKRIDKGMFSNDRAYWQLTISPTLQSIKKERQQQIRLIKARTLKRMV